MAWPEPETVTKGLQHSTMRERMMTILLRSDRSNMQSKHPINHWSTSNLEDGRMLEPFNKPWSTLRTCMERLCLHRRRYGGRRSIWNEHGPENAGHQEKLVDMPLCEAIIVHTGVGAALSGMRPMVEIQFGGFAALGFNALINNAAMLRWRWGADCPMTIRVPLGAALARAVPCEHDRIVVCQRSRAGRPCPRNAARCLRLLVEAAHLDDPVCSLNTLAVWAPWRKNRMGSKHQSERRHIICTYIHRTRKTPFNWKSIHCP